ncbi:MAG: gp436 family protein [Sodalis sp. (in: enterobacteria)]|uniref:gp436 family protein n=1 Tax=Sodalis sp. (in: enterobacteria) TaxID=1898979 RepID=UPI003F40FE5B
MYARLEDMVLRFGEQEVRILTDRDNTGEINASVLAGGLQATADEINGYIGGRYTLPLPVASSDLCGIACDIARYRLTGTERVGTDEIRGRYRNPICYLENVANGRVTLATTQSGGAPRATPGRRSFPVAASGDATRPAEGNFNDKRD